MTEYALDLSEEELWQRFQWALSGEDGAVSRDDVRSPEDDVHVVSALAEIHEHLTITQRNFLAKKMVERVHRSILSTKPLERIDLRILSLSFPYFTKSDLCSEARTVVYTAFNEEYWRERDHQDTLALVDALLDLGHGQKTPKKWLEYYNYAVGIPGLASAAFDQTCTALTEINAHSFFRFVRREKRIEWVTERISAYLPALLERQGSAAVSQHLAAYMRERPTTADALNGLARALGLEFSPNDSRDPIERHLMFVQQVLDFEASEPGGDEKAEVAESGLITAICSDYTKNVRLIDFQYKMIAEIEGRLDAGMLRTKGSSTFDEAPADISGLQRIVFAFPMYLTDSKRQMGYGVIPYGVQKRIGVMMPLRNGIGRNIVGEVDLVQLLTRASESNNTIFYQRNYAIGEMATQCVDQNSDLRKTFDRAKIRSIELESRVEGGARFPWEILDTPSSDWIYLFDLGDLSTIRNQVNNRDDVLVATVRHDLNIQVGLGFNKYMVPWMLQEKRWSVLGQVASRLVSELNLEEDMRELGIEVLGGLASDGGTKVVRLRGNRRAGSSGG